MTEHHHFVQHFLDPGYGVNTEFTCTAPEGAVCRVACQTCYDEQREVCECEYIDPPRKSNIIDQGCCLMITWLNEDSPEECYNGERAPVRGPEPQPITPEWTGDNYDWDYAI